MTTPDVTVEPTFDKKGSCNLNKKQMKTKWNLKFSCSETAHKMFSEVEKRRDYGEWDKPTFSVLNQLFSGHSILNSHQAKVDKNVSNICETCHDRAGGCHFLFHCGRYSTEGQFGMDSGRHFT